MNRFCAVLCIVFIIGLIFVEASYSRAESIWPGMVIYIGSSAFLAMSLLLYCGFATLHAVQHVSDPVERAWWVILTVVLNIAGSCIYYFTKYRSFRKIGKGGIILRPNQTLNKLSQLSESELNPNNTVEETTADGGASG